MIKFVVGEAEKVNAEVQTFRNSPTLKADRGAGMPPFAV